MANRRSKKLDRISAYQKNADASAEALSMGSGRGEPRHKIAIYCRVSSEKQKDEQTVRVQQKTNGEYYERLFAAEHDFTGLYLDEAYNAERYSPASDLARLFHDIEAKKITALVVYKLDRIFRSVSSDEFKGRIKDVFNRNSLVVFCASDGSIHRYGTADPGQRIINAINEEFSVQNKRSAVGRLAAGRWSRVKEHSELFLVNAPFGYRVVKERVVVGDHGLSKNKTATLKKRNSYRLVKDDREAAVVRDIFRLYTGLERVRGLIVPDPIKKFSTKLRLGEDAPVFSQQALERFSTSQIAAILNANHISREAWARATPSAKNAKNGITVWVRKHVQQIVRNETYTGTLEVGVSGNKDYNVEQQVILVPVPATITKEMYAVADYIAVSCHNQTTRAQKQFDVSVHHKNILSGVLSCSDCRVDPTTTGAGRLTARRKQRGEDAYVCRRRSGHRSFGAEQLNERFRSLVFQLFRTEQSLDDFVGRYFRLSQISDGTAGRFCRRLKEIESALDGLFEVKKLWTELLSEGSIDRSEFKRLATEQTADRMRLETEKADVEMKLSSLEQKQSRAAGKAELRLLFEAMARGPLPILRRAAKATAAGLGGGSDAGSDATSRQIESAKMWARAVTGGYEFLDDDNRRVLDSFLTFFIDSFVAEVSVSDDDGLVRSLAELADESERATLALRLYAGGYLCRQDAAELMGLSPKLFKTNVQTVLGIKSRRKGRTNAFLMTIVLKNDESLGDEPIFTQITTGRLSELGGA